MQGWLSPITVFKMFYGSQVKLYFEHSPFKIAHCFHIGVISTEEKNASPVDVRIHILIEKNYNLVDISTSSWVAKHSEWLQDHTSIITVSWDHGYRFSFILFVVLVARRSHYDSKEHKAKHFFLSPEQHLTAGAWPGALGGMLLTSRVESQLLPLLFFLFPAPSPLLWKSNIAHQFSLGCSLAKTGALHHLIF